MDMPDVADEVLNLNVGGCIYSTIRSTLTRYPDSMLGSMFSGRYPTSVDDCNRYVIDGDGPTFRHILNFLRRSKLVLPDGFKEWDILSAEADSYQLHELVQLIDETRKQIRDDDETRTQIPHKAKYEFIEVTAEGFSWRIFCKTEIYRQLLEKYSDIFGLKPHKMRDDYMSEFGCTIRFADGRTTLFELLTTFDFSLISTSTVCHNNSEIVEKWTFSRKKVAKD